MMKYLLLLFIIFNSCACPTTPEVEDERYVAPVQVQYRIETTELIPEFYIFDGTIPVHTEMVVGNTSLNWVSPVIPYYQHWLLEYWVPKATVLTLTQPITIRIFIDGVEAHSDTIDPTTYTTSIRWQWIRPYQMSDEPGVIY